MARVALMLLVALMRLTAIEAPPTVTIISPALGASQLNDWPLTVSVTAISTVGISQVQFSLTSSTNGISSGTVSAPSPAGSNTYTYTFPSYVWPAVPAGSEGYAVTISAMATDANYLSATAVPISIAVIPDPIPMVSITSPANGSASYSFGTPLTINVNAHHPAGIYSVSIFNGSMQLATLTSAPYSYVWNSPQSGTLTATAIANNPQGLMGLAATSAPVTISVVPNTGPTVSITSPANGSINYSNVPLTIKASATSLASISSVQFYNGYNLIATLTQPPFNYTWANPMMGNETLTVTAFDSSGISATSAPVAISVVPDPGPSISIAQPANGATSLGSTMIANASSPIGIQSVKFLSNGTVFATFTSGPYSFTGTIPYGTLTAQATDTQGMISTSAPVSIITPPVSGQTASITYPTNGATALYLNPQYPLILSANATSSAGIRSVQFYQNGASIGTSTTAPYTCQVANPPFGQVTFSIVATDNTGYVIPSAPVTATVQQDNGPGVSIANPLNGSTVYNANPIVLTAAITSPTTNVGISSVSYYNGSSLLGTATSAPWTYTWSNPPLGNQTLNVTAMDAFGIVSAAAIPTIVTVVVDPGPAATMTNPANGAIAYTGQPISLSATVTSPIAISSVQFYQGSTQLGTATQTPGTNLWNYTWTNPPAGTSQLTAHATDANSVMMISIPISITVEVDPGPIVSIAAPINATPYCAGSPMTITANVASPSSTVNISSVQFFQGTTLLGTVNSAPWQYTWTNPTAGIAILTAKATDALQVAATSAPSYVVVEADPGPTVVLSGVAPNSSVLDNFPSTLTATCSALTPLGIASVSYYANATLIGTSASAPYSVPWTHTTDGAVSVTAIAKDTQGMQTTSAAIPVTVVPDAGPTVTVATVGNATTYVQTQPIPLTATASSLAGVKSVAFYQGTTLIGTVTTSPYNLSWTPSSLGTYVIKAIATDTLNIPNSSSTLSLTVIANSSPAFAAAPIISPVSPVAATSATISDLTATYETGEPNLTYTWLVRSYPGSIYPGFADTSTNAAKSTTMTFHAAGTYVVACVAHSPTGWTGTSPDLTFTVSQVVTSISVVSPSSLAPMQTGQFTANVLDQFGSAMTASLTWSLAPFCPAIMLNSATGLIQATSGAVTGQYTNTIYSPNIPIQITAASGAISGSGSCLLKPIAMPVATIGVVAQDTVYRGANGANAMTTSTAYTWGIANLPQTKTITSPAVPTTENGSGTATSAIQIFDAYGRMIWAVDQEAYYTYLAYDVTTGAVVTTIQDVNVNLTSEFLGFPVYGVPGNPNTVPGFNNSVNHLNLITTRNLDALGRPTKVTDSSGSITYFTYNDPGHEMRSYPGWNSATNSPTGPTVISRENWTGNYREKLSISTSPSMSGGIPTGLETPQTVDVQSLHREILNGNFQTINVYDYISIPQPGASYAYNSSPVIPGVTAANYALSTYAYDGRGRLNQETDATGTITSTLFDVLSRPVSVSTGTSTAPLNQIKSIQYDGPSLIGDGTPTAITIYGDVGAQGVAVQYVTTNTYDYRDRLLTSVGADQVLTVRTLDNLGNIIKNQSYANNNSSLATNLRAQTSTSFDERNMPFQSTVYEVDPILGSQGSQSNTLTSNMWYSPRGYPIANRSPNGLLRKSTYDGAGRVQEVSSSITPGSMTYANALNRTSDNVIESESLIMDHSGMVVAKTDFKRLDNDTTTIGELTTTNSFYKVCLYWYDLAHRTIATADYGRDNGATRYVYATNGALIANSNGLPNLATLTPPVPNGAVTDYHVTAYNYNSSGQLSSITDPMGFITVKTYDFLNHVLSTIENYSTGIPAAGKTAMDRTTQFTYNTGGTLASQTAIVATTSSLVNQITNYYYTSTNSAHLLTSIKYPDTGSNQVIYAYDRLGRKTTSTDQRGVVHAYTFDPSGRPTVDAATTIPTGVDPTVKSIQCAYDDFSRPISWTSTDATSGGNILDQYMLTYNAYGTVAKSQQSHSGAVTTSTPAVIYSYADGAASGIARFIRLSSIVYPTATGTEYILYPTTGSIGDALNRIYEFAADGAGNTAYAQYSYLGASIVNKLSMPFATSLTQSFGSGGAYTGWDRFGRTINAAWMSGSTILDGFAYTYDDVSNRLSKQQIYAAPLIPNNDEGATYDGLNRLTGNYRGILNSSNQIPSASSTWQETWAYDGVGNWLTNTVNPAGGSSTAGQVIQSRSMLGANEIASISIPTLSVISPIYDSAGNITYGPRPGSMTTRQWYTWDAWNRLRKVNGDSGNATTPGAQLAVYHYDARGRRIQSTYGASGATNVDDFFYNESSEILETRRASSTTGIPNSSMTAYEQFIWDQRYVDTPICRLRSPTNTGSLTETDIFLTDANHNVTSITSTSGSVLERYSYDPYGARTIYNASGTVIPTSAYDNRIAFTGHHLDVETGEYFCRARYFDPALGTWLGRDPVGYVDGGSLYQYCRSNPWGLFDSYGLTAQGNPPSFWQQLWMGLSNPSQLQDQFNATLTPQDANNLTSQVSTFFAAGATAPLAVISGTGTAAGLNNAAVATYSYATAYLFPTEIAAATAAVTITTGVIEADATGGGGVTASSSQAAQLVAQEVQNSTNAGYLFRGTSIGYDGGRASQITGLTPASTDPGIAALFAIESSNYGQGVIHVIAPGTVPIGASNVLSNLESEVGILLSPAQVAAQAQTSLSVQQARQILQEMGISLPGSITSYNALSSAVSGSTMLTPQQIQQVVQAANGAPK